jgi:RNA polymerase sigma factor (sigma-70 family)
MVLGVCQRILGNRQEAEDAFQATFLVLAQEAGVVLRRGVVLGAWLYRTAYHMAQHARREAARRNAREKRRAELMVREDPSDELELQEVRNVLDDELGRLPERYRQPLVLCYFAGLTHDQAAFHLQMHPRTLERRLQSAHELLHQRLTRRGIALSLGFLVTLLAGGVEGVVSAALASGTTHAAVAMATGEANAPFATPEATSLACWYQSSQWKNKTLWKIAGVVGGIGLVGSACLLWLLFSSRTAKEQGVEQPSVSQIASPVEVVKPPITIRKGKPGARTITVRGRVIDADGRPVSGIPVLILARPVLSGGTLEPIPDRLATLRTQVGRFRELARGLTDPDGRYEVTGTLVIPDPTTSAQWFHTLPFAVSRTSVRLVDQEAQFRDLHPLAVGIGTEQAQE